MGARFTRLVCGQVLPGLALCTLALPDPAVGDDQATTYRIDAARTGAVAGPGPAPPLTRLWKRELGTRVEYPLLAEGKLFVVARRVSTDRHELFALDPATGTTLWSRQLGTEGARIAYASGSIFASNVNGITRALDATTGNTAWTRFQPGDISGNSTTPIVVGDQLLETEDYGDHRGAAQARSTVDGQLRWRRDDGLLHPASDGSALFTGDDCPRLLARSLLDGGDRWSMTPDRGCRRDGPDIVSVYDGKVFDRHYRPLGNDTYEGAVLGTATGNEIRTFRAESELAFRGSTAYYLRDGRLRAEDVDTGAELWTSSDSTLTLAPIVVGDHVYSAAADGTLVGFDRATGGARWSAAGGEPLPATDPGYRYPEWRGALAAGQGVLALTAGKTISAYAATPPPAREPPATPLAPGGGSAQRDETVTYRGGPARTAWTESSPLRPPLSTLWSHPITADALSFPLIAGGRTFVLAQDMNGPARDDFDTRLIAVSSSTGGELWSAPVAEGHDPYSYDDERPDFGLAYGGDKVITMNASGDVQARSAVDGTIRWTAQRPGQQEAASSPVVIGNTVYIAEACGAARYDDVRVISHDLATGAIRGTPQKCTVDPGYDAPGLGSDGQTLYLGLSGSARAVDRLSGVERWSVRIPSGVFARSPLVLDGSVYLGDSAYESPVVNARTGALEDAFQSHHAPALTRQIMVSSDFGTLRATDRKGGRTIWEKTLPGTDDADNSRWFRPPVVVGENVYSVASGGQFFVHDLASGAERWRGDMGSDIGFAGEYLRNLTTGISAGEGLIVIPTRAGLVALAGPAGHQVPAPEPIAPVVEPTTPDPVPPVDPTPLPPAFSPSLSAPLRGNRPDRRAPSISVAVRRPARFRSKRSGLHRGRAKGGLPVAISISVSVPRASLVVFSRKRSRSGAVRERRVATIEIGRLGAGRSTVTFFGGLDGRRRLAPGRYSLAVHASDAAGNRGVSGRVVVSVQAR